MSAWRGRLAQVVPDPILRRAIGAVDKAQLPAFRGPASELRDRGAARLAEALAAYPAESATETLLGEAWHVVRQEPGTGEDRLVGHLRRSGLAVVADAGVHGPPGTVASFRVADPALHGRRGALSNALAAPLALVGERPPVPAKDILAVDFPVDAVYTWVDGSDPRWLETRRAAAGARAAGLPPTSNDDARFASHDELRYSLRSLEYFAPWIRHVHLVTAGQVPDWLDTSAPGITVVDHGEIFADPSHLPTFNSHAIEANLHRISGLTEQFLYLNDDVFLGRGVGPETFFTPGGAARIFPSRQRIQGGPGALPVDTAAANNRAVLLDRFQRTASFKFKHTVHAQVRSTLEDIDRDYPELVAATSAARFRSDSDLSIPSSLAHYYGVGTGRAVVSSVDYRYVDLDDPRAQLLLARLLWNAPPEMFCLNQVRSVRDGQARGAMLANFLGSFFPFPSRFEKAVGTRG